MFLVILGILSHTDVVDVGKFVCVCVWLWIDVNDLDCELSNSDFNLAQSVQRITTTEPIDLVRIIRQGKKNDNFVINIIV